MWWTARPRSKKANWKHHRAPRKGRSDFLGGKRKPVGATLAVARGRGRTPPLRPIGTRPARLATMSLRGRTAPVVIRSPLDLCRGVTDSHDQCAHWPRNDTVFHMRHSGAGRCGHRPLQRCYVSQRSRATARVAPTKNPCGAGPVCPAAVPFPQKNRRRHRPPPERVFFLPCLSSCPGRRTCRPGGLRRTGSRCRGGWR